MSPVARRTIAERFDEKVDRSAGPDGCWIWTAHRDHHGYGRISNENGRKGPVRKAHRVAYHLATGVDPAGLEVCHRCDNPPCVNPAHLFLGTHAENMADSAAKGRNFRGVGADNPRTKYPDEVIAEVCRLRAAGVRVVELAARYGMTPRYVYAITNGERRGHLAAATPTGDAA